MSSNERKAPVTGSLIFAIFSAAFGSSFLFGYNMGVINSPQKVIGLWIRQINCDAAVNRSASELWCGNLTAKQTDDMFTDNASLNTIWTLVVSLFCLGGLFGALSTGYFVEKLGRRGTLLWNNIISLISCVILSLPSVAGSYEMLIVGRFIVGISAGVNSGVPATYLNEISPAHLKGAIGSLHQLSVTIAISLSQVFGLEQIFGNEWGWPILFALSAIPSIYQLATLPFCPESPKYLYISKNDEVGARKALERLRGSNDVDDEIAQMDVEREQMKLEPAVSTLGLFKNPLLRKITIICAMLMVCQQFSGINAVMFYSTNIFRSAGLGNDAQYATIGMGGVNVLMTVISVFLVERAGRRTLLLTGFVGMSLTIILLTISMVLFESGGGGDAVYNPYLWASYIATPCVIIFVIFFATGPGSIPWFLVSELFTQGPRGAATSIAVGTNWLCSLIVALAFPLIQAQIKAYTFIIFAGVLVISTVYIFFQVIETKGKSQEEIQNELKYGKKGMPAKQEVAFTPKSHEVQQASTAI